MKSLIKTIKKAAKYEILISYCIGSVKLDRTGNDIGNVSIPKNLLKSLEPEIFGDMLDALIEEKDADEL